MTESAPLKTLLICCGAIAPEIVAIVKRNGWRDVRVQCLPPQLHNDPAAIPNRVRAKIQDNRANYDKILVLYADCGTGGQLQQVLDEEGVEGIGGAHCYEVFAGAAFNDIMQEEPGCFFVTDFLARNFQRLVFQGLGLDRFPKLRKVYFGNYKKLVYLAQSERPELKVLAEEAAHSIGLEFEMRYTGDVGYEHFLSARRNPAGR